MQKIKLLKKGSTKNEQVMQIKKNEKEEERGNQNKSYRGRNLKRI